MCKTKKIDLNKIAHFIYKSLKDSTTGKNRITGKEIYDNLENIIGVNPAEINENKIKPIIKGIVDNNSKFFESKLGRAGGIYLRPDCPECKDDYEFDIPDSLLVDIGKKEKDIIENKSVEVVPVAIVEKASSEIVRDTLSATEVIDKIEKSKKDNSYLHDELWDLEKPVKGTFDGFKYKMKGRLPIKVKLSTKETHLETWLDEKHMQTILKNVLEAKEDENGIIECMGKKFSVSEDMAKLFEKIMLHCFDAVIMG